MTKAEEKVSREIKGKKVLVVGLGLLGGGVGLVRFLYKMGAQVRVTDLKTHQELLPSMQKLAGVTFSSTFGGHELSDFLWADIVFKSPSMQWDSPYIQSAQLNGAKVEMEVAFFAKFCICPIIGITGTRGKSTTTAMIFEILKNASVDVHVGGNVAETSTVELLSKIKPNSIVILELSSWALSAFHHKKISPHIGVLTNFYPDHMNYYKNEEDYLFDKKAIYMYQNKNDFLVINKVLQKIPPQDNYKGKLTTFSSYDFSGKLKLFGPHNQENAAAAQEVARILSINQKIIQSTLENFNGLPARLERVGRVDNVTFINDSTSTMPEATMRALDALEDKPIFLILGGNAKGLSSKELTVHLVKAHRIFLVPGAFTQDILPQVKKLYQAKLAGVFESLDSATHEASREAHEFKKPSYVVFSPAATSFAQFKNEFDRARKFNEIVDKIVRGK